MFMTYTYTVGFMAFFGMKLVQNGDYLNYLFHIFQSIIFLIVKFLIINPLHFSEINKLLMKMERRGDYKNTNYCQQPT